MSDVAIAKPTTKIATIAPVSSDEQRAQEDVEMKEDELVKSEMKEVSDGIEMMKIAGDEEGAKQVEEKLKQVTEET